MLGVSFFSKIVFSLLLGLVVALVWFQFDERVISLVNRNMEQVFEQELNCVFRGRVKKLRPLSLLLEFEDVCVEPCDKQEAWSWRAGSMKMQLSVLHYLYTGFFGLQVQLEKIRAQSAIEQRSLTILKHVQSMFVGADFSMPIAFQRLVITDGRLTAHDAQQSMSITCGWNNSATVDLEEVKAQFYLFDTTCTMDSQHVFKDMTGSVTLEVGKSGQYVVSTDVVFVLPQLPEGQQKCYALGTWDYDVGNFVVYNQERTFSFVPIHVVMRGGQPFFKAEGVFLCAYLQKLLFPFIQQPCEGMCTLEVSGDFTTALRGKLTLSDVAYNGYTLGNSSVSFIRKGMNWHGSLHGTHDNAQITGLFDWSENTQQGVFFLTNRTSLTCFNNNYWQCVPRKTLVQGAWNTAGFTTLSYATLLRHVKTEKEVKSDGEIHNSDHDITFYGTVGSSLYEGHFYKNPLRLRSFIYKDHTGTERITISSSLTDTSHITASIDYECLRDLLQTTYDSALPGHGMFKVHGTLEYPSFKGSVHLCDGVIRFSGMYNYISDALSRISLDFENYTATFSDTKIQLHQGVIKSKRALLQFNSDGSLQSAHVPWNFSQCFINWEKYLYALCSGALVFQIKNNEERSLNGFVSLDKSQFKENIFALKTQQSFASSVHVPSNADVQVNLSISTQEPLLIATDHLQTQALIDATIRNTLQSPEMHGSLFLKGGKLHFPGETLSIAQGKITFVHTQPDDPLVELVAQGRIKKYIVTVSVGGSAKEPHVSLSSVPSLSEEQIIMLLLTGTEHESFNVMVPTLVMRNIETIVFGSSGPFGHTEKPFTSWIKPLERITFVPRFTDQTGRGGFKGALEIELSQRLRAVLEKNFSLSEDTAVEVEYLLSDDVSLRFIKDERGDIGAEVEMRFKF